MIIKSPTPPGQGNGRSSWPRGLILAPTRELVQQIYDEARKFTYKTGLRCAVAYGGGENMRDQLRSWRAPPFPNTYTYT